MRPRYQAPLPALIPDSTPTNTHTHIRLFTFVAELQRAEAPPPLLSQCLELNGQAMAVPARDKVDLAAPQNLKPVTDVLQDLPQERGRVLNSSHTDSICSAVAAPQQTAAIKVQVLDFSAGAGSHHQGAAHFRSVKLKTEGTSHVAVVAGRLILTGSSYLSVCLSGLRCISR